MAKKALAKYLADNYMINGMVDISNLDFRPYGCSVCISGMKVADCLYQNHQKVEGYIIQDSHKAKKGIVQSRHKTEGFIFQCNQKAKRVIQDEIISERK